MDAWLTRLYDRFGAWYVWGAIGFGLMFPLVFVPVLLVFPADYFELTTREWLISSLVADLALLVYTGLAVAVGLRTPVVGALAWSAGRRSDELAATAGEWAFDALRRADVRNIVFLPVLATPVIVFACLVQSRYTTLADVIGLSIPVFTTAVIIGLTGHALFEFLRRPARASLHLRQIPTVPVPSIAIIALATPPLGLFLTAGAINFVTLERSAGADELLRAWAIAGACAALAAIPFFVVTFGMVLNPLRRLIHAHRAVGAGDLSRLDVVSADEIGELTASFNQMLDGLEERGALQARNVSLVDELRASRSRIVAASDEARRKVERDLHDGAQQHLTLLKLKLSLLDRLVREHPEAAKLTAELARDLDRALAQLRDLAHGIYPAILTSDGLPGALHGAANQASIVVGLDCDEAGRYRPEIEAAVYFCCLEALQNAAKHGGPGTGADIRLAEADGVLHFQISDDGCGFDAAAYADSSGIQNMADRIGALGGELEIHSTPGTGTTVTGRLSITDQTATRH